MAPYLAVVYQSLREPDGNPDELLPDDERDYGNNSGGYDHTGFGDLMYSDRPVTAEQTPTILFPVIAGKTETRKYAEIRDVESGAVLTLSATLPEGESNTGKWTWDDGADSNGRSRLNIPEYIVLRTRIPME